jgi:transcriptional regulator with XRE-family HTH domain
MLTKHVVEPRRKRTSNRSTTEEGLALKELRLSKGLSMRGLGQLIGKSDSYISHLENGRLDFPSGPALERILAAFGDMKPKSFFERARSCRARTHQEEFICKWIRKASDTDLKAVYSLISNG